MDNCTYGVNPCFGFLGNICLKRDCIDNLFSNEEGARYTP
jgi:hypothetical protein